MILVLFDSEGEMFAFWAIAASFVEEMSLEVEFSTAEGLFK